MAALEERPVQDISTLPTVTFGERSLSWWGTLGFMVIEGTTLALCAWSYIYLRKNFLSWPPLHTPPPSLLIPTIQLIVMVLSMVPMYVAARFAKRLALEPVRWWLVVGAVMKVAVLVLRWYEFKALHTRWNSNGYGSIAWSVLGFHTTLLVVDFAEDVGLLMILWGHEIQQRYFSDVTDDAMYWYFTVLSWVPLAAMVFYWPNLQ